MKKIFVIILLSFGNVFADDIEKDSPESRKLLLERAEELIYKKGGSEGTKGIQYLMYAAKNWVKPEMEEDQYNACLTLFAVYYQFHEPLKRKRDFKKCSPEFKDLVFSKKDRDYKPLVKYYPGVPQVAFDKGVGGYATVEYTITKEGRTKDVLLVEASDEMFVAPSIKTASQFIYLPKIENKKIVESKGVKNTFYFKVAPLEE